ncbi:MAG: hypothetical protein S4CHLAM6_05200 [Chlamydiae bacterium]|nr:hypothetical protein [Chlamydiota bacterium]
MRNLIQHLKKVSLTSFVVVCCFYSRCYADDGTWQGVDATWATITNWTSNPNPVPGPGNTATFLLGGGNTAVNMPGTALGNLLLSDGTYTFSVGVGALTPTTITVNSTGITTFNAGALGSGALTNTGAGNLIFAGANTLTSINQNVAGGTLTVNAALTTGTNTLTTGTITGTGSLSGALTQADGTVSGTLTIGGLFTQNGGVISPASAGTLGTITLGAGYTQNAGSTYTTSIDPTGDSDILDVTGTSALNGIVNLDPLPGIYTENTLYTLLTSTGAITGNPTLTETHPLDFRLFIQGTALRLRILENAIVLPVNLSDLPINSQRVASYLYADVTPDGPIRELVLTTLTSPAGVFADTLLQLSPIQYGAFGLVGLQNNVHMANVLSRRAVNTLCSDPQCTENYRQMWVEPIGFYYHQKPHNRQRGFDDYTYGVAYGMEFPLCRDFTVGGSLGYTHSNIVWYPNLGDAHSNTVYLGLNAGFSQSLTGDPTSIGFVNFLLQGDIDFYSCNRTIQIPNFKRVAGSNHNSYNFLARVDGGIKFSANESNTFFIQPETQLNYLNLFEVGYKEIGAGLADLQVNYKHTVFLQPNAKVRFIKQFKNKDLCYTPNVYLGWLANVPITSGRYTAHMYNVIAGEREFSVTSYHEYANQLVVGGEFSVTRCEDFLLNVGYEGDLLYRFDVHAVTIRLEWTF